MSRRNSKRYLRCTYCDNDHAEWRVVVMSLNSVIFARFMCVECGGVLVVEMRTNALLYLEKEGALPNEQRVSGVVNTNEL